MPAKRRRTTKDYDRIDFRGLRDLRAVTINPETEKPFKQGEIAAKAEIQQQTYSKIELGDTYNPSREIVQKIAAAFSRSYAELLNAMPVREARAEQMVRQFIPNYVQPYSPRGFVHRDGVLKDNANQIEEPHYLRNCNGYALTMPANSMKPRYQQGDVLFCNPEISPQMGDDVVIQLQYKDRLICLVREVIDVQPVKFGKVYKRGEVYGVISASEKDQLRCQNYNYETYNDWITEMGFLVDYMENFIEQDPEDEITLLKDGVSGEPITNEDGSHITIAEFSRMTESLGGRQTVSAVAVHTVVGSQRHLNPRDRSHVFMEVKHPLEMEAKVGQVTVKTTNVSDT